MPEEPSEIEHEIEEQREQLAHHLSELQYRVERATDWRTYLREKQDTIIAVGIGVCIFAGILMIRR